jgi:hypothetical protein
MNQSIIYNDIQDCIQQSNSFQELDEIQKENIKLKYDIVMKDIIIYSLNKTIKLYKHNYDMWDSFQKTFLK